MRGTDSNANGPGSRVLDPTDASPLVRRALTAWLRLQSALCLSPVLARSCLEAAGGDPVAALARSGKQAPMDAPQIGAWVRALSRLGVRALPFTAAEYPAGLRALSDPPPLLLVRGEIGDLSRPAVAIVGARAATRYGRGVAEELGAAIAAAGFVVVSGLARGVDAAAHRGALASGGRTVAILGSGLDRIYPPEHADLADQVSRSGAVVSELPLGRPPAAPHFPLRNRLISGLVQAVVVVEAKHRSGSLITARHALNQGREVLVVPGPIDSANSAGSNTLLRDGAKPVLDASDVLNAISPFEVGLSAVDSLPSIPDPDQAHIHALLLEESRDRDTLARELAWSPGRFALALSGLEMEGWLEVERDGRLYAVSARRHQLRSS